jgi:hypothetical protein
MKKTGLADSPFFEQPPEKRKAPSPPPSKEKVPKKKSKATKKSEKSKETKQADNHGPEQPGNHETRKPRNHETTVSRYHDTAIEVIRKAVKDFGKEAATHRFTPEEKKAVADLIYTYKNRGLRTSENEITRIAVNFILHDYQEHGEESILARTLKALNE